MTSGTIPREAIDTKGHVVISPIHKNVTVWDFKEFAELGLGPQCYDISPTCSTCGEYVSDRLNRTDGGYEVVVGPCPHPDGLEPYKNTFTVSSGAIAFADDLRYALGVDPGDSVKVSYNSTRGRHLVYDEYYKRNVAYGFVSNTMPRLYFDTATGDIYVASAGIYEEGEESETGTDEKPVPATWRNIGQICTDLWAYTIMDAQEFKDTGADVKDYGWMQKPDYAEVPNGTYEVTHFADRFGFDFYSSDLTIYAMFRNISD